jgi:hypothetical protein
MKNEITMRTFRLAKRFDQLFFCNLLFGRYSWFAITLLFFVQSVNATTYYVDASQPDDTGTGTRWDTAKKTIQAAVDITSNGDTVLVTNGVYNTGTTATPGYVLKNRLVITNAITVRSINGPAMTVIEGSGTNFYNTSSAVRCVYMKAGTLDGFTLQQGATYGTGLGSSDANERYGGGVNMFDSFTGTIVTNSIIRNCTALFGGGAYGGNLNTCIFIENTAACEGGGVMGSKLINCKLLNNAAFDGGGGACDGTLSNCKLSGNSAYSGGGSKYGTLNNCTLSGNSANYGGGGACYGILTNCTFFGNSASSGGGSYDATLNNCSLSDNKAASAGGGSFGGTLNNCTLSGNTAGYAGGGSCGGTLNNCALSGNTATSSGGGAFNGTLNNCIVSNNTKTDGTLNNYTDVTFYYSCTTPLPSGFGNIDLDPQFVDRVNLRLRSGSPCVDAGDNLYVKTATDLADNPRIQNDTVDMGAYEGAVLATAAPVLTPPSGTRFTDSMDVVITCATDDAVIRYTLDGSEPVETNATYTAPVTLSESALIWVKSFKAGHVAAQAMASYVRCVADPLFTPADGTGSTNELTVSITCATSNSVIRYTLDGTEPTENSTEYTNVLTLTQSANVKAKAFKPGLEASLTVTANFTVLQEVAEPVFNPVSRTIATNSLVVTLSCATLGSTIRYTLDGTVPNSMSARYYGSFTITQSTTVKAKGFKSGMIDSNVATVEYTILKAVTTPAILPASGTYFSGFRKVTMSCATDGAEIRYTIDETVPTRSSSLYTAPFNISKTTTFSLKAFKDGMADSLMVTATYYKLPPLSEAVDVTNLLVTTGGSANWFSQGGITHDGVDAAQSGSITNNQSTWIETSVTGPATLSFWWRTSCENDLDADNWDYLKLSLDGIEQSRVDGMTEWRHVTCKLGSGMHLVRWEYVKDESVSEGSDCAWIDQVSFTTGNISATVSTPVPVPYSWLEQYPLLLEQNGNDYEEAALADADGDGHFAWQEYVAGSNPTNRESVFQTMISISNGLPWITWSPDLRPDRMYTVKGKTYITDAAWSPTNAASHFFKVNVELP